MSIPTIGDKIVDVVLEDLNGNSRKLSDFAGKYQLLSFWSLTCMICMKAASGLKNIHNQHGDKINIISINMDTEKSMWEQGTNRDGISWSNLSDSKGPYDGVGKIYGIVSYPAYVLINPDGIIIDRWMGYKPGRFEEKLADILN